MLTMQVLLKQNSANAYDASFAKAKLLGGLPLMNYRKLSELTIEEVVALWNRGFEGYFVDLTMSVNMFLTRIVNEGLSLEHSFAAFVDHTPVGFVVNGFREIAGKKVAWNGGTGIVTEYRGKGLGQELMEHKLQLYKEQGVNLATLEALEQNERAIKLYLKAGFEITDHIIIFQETGPLASQLLQLSDPPAFAMKKGLPREARFQPFYKSFSAWQTQWFSIKDGESLLITDEGETICYALFKYDYNEAGCLTAITLYQCEALPHRLDAKHILKIALGKILRPLDSNGIRKRAYVQKSNPLLQELLEELGFKQLVAQALMTRQMDE
jgi:GNAT superfamily N-acetyltransferase